MQYERGSELIECDGKKCLGRIPVYYSSPWEFPENEQWKESLAPTLTGSYVPQTTLNYS